jgi:hypothetical protein
LIFSQIVEPKLSYNKQKDGTLRTQSFLLTEERVVACIVLDKQNLSGVLLNEETGEVVEQFQSSNQNGLKIKARKVAESYGVKFDGKSDNPNEIVDVDFEQGEEK